ncbi:hypothetical protein [Bifidobacterium aquikefiricola]|uniref:Glycosyltransferase n=1 Tax=Bifidobacterium aquikefiricola TaxID=3059038 RepID=A0AB39U4Y1_9BIFI
MSLSRFNPNRSRYGIAVAALTVLVLIACVEIFGFNLAHWRTLSNDPQTLQLADASQHKAGSHIILGSGLRYSTASETLTVTDATSAYLDVSTNANSISSLTMHVREQHVALSDSQNVSVRIDTRAYDSSSKTANRTSSNAAENTEHAKNADGTASWSVSGTHTINAEVSSSLTMRVRPTSAQSSTTRIWIQEPNDTTLTISSITLNPRIPLNFSPLRMALMALAVAAVLALLPRSRLWSTQLDTSRKGQRWVMGITIAAIAIYGLVGIITSIAAFTPQQFHHPGSYTYDYNQYAYLADALLHGRPWLDLEVPQRFAQLADPYDVAARERLLGSGVTPIYWDYAFFNGRWYSYFGVIPAVLLYMPYQATTSLWVRNGLMLPTPAAMSLLTALGMIFAVLLVIRILRRHFPHASLATTVISVITVLLATNFPYLTSSGMFYTIPTAASLALTFMGLWFWLGARGSSARLSYAHIVAGSVCIAMNLGCRPTFILAALLAIPIFGPDAMKFIRTRHIKAFCTTLACGIIPAIVIVMPLLAYNYWRFGSITNFGNNYQITVTNMTQYTAPLSTMAPVIGYYLALPPNFTSSFPWVDYAPVPLNSWQYAEPALGGIFFIAPMLLMMAALPFLTSRLHQRHILASAYSMLGLGILLLLFNAYKAGFSWRYMLDFTWLFSLVSVLCIAEVLSHIPPRTSTDASSITTHDMGQFHSNEHAIAHQTLIQWIILALLFMTAIMSVLGVLLLSERNDPTSTLAIAQWFSITQWCSIA